MARGVHLTFTDSQHSAHIIGIAFYQSGKVVDPERFERPTLRFVV